MYCIIPESDDPFFNLAIEELLLKNRKDEYLILSINKPSVILGKHQSTHREVNTRYLSENSIPVIRRISGGGTVFHDHGNLNFCFISQSEDGKQVDFQKYTRPVIDYLSSLGVEAKFGEKNDLKVGGFKISGNAEHVHRNRVLHHGTLLFSTSLDVLRNVLRKDSSHYTSRAVKSNPSPVMNLKENLNRFNDIYEFRSDMMNYFINNLHGAVSRKFNTADTEEAESLALSKYKTWQWNYAYGPEYQYVNTFEFSGKQIYCRLSVKDGTIRDFILEGFSELKVISRKLIGRKHMVEDFKEVFQEENISDSDLGIFNFF